MHIMTGRPFWRACEICIFVLMALSVYHIWKAHLTQMGTRAAERNDPEQNAIVTPRKLILLSYIRSGSSFLGALFSTNKDVCYWYEPVEGILHHAYGFSRQLHSLDIYFGQEGKVGAITGFEEKSLKHYLFRMLSNPPSKMPLDFLYNRLSIRTKVQWSRSVRNCIKKFTGVDDYDPLLTYKKRKCGCKSPDPPLSQLRQCHSQKITENLQNQTYPTCLAKTVQCHQKCVQRLQEKAGTCVELMDDWCKSSKVSVTKTVRLPMSLVEEIMDETNDIRVVHYVRDPRGMYLSMKDANLISRASKGHWFREMELLCSNIMDNILAMERIRLKYPEKVMTLRYEDLAERPLHYAEKLYSFINLSLSASIKDLISNSTNAPGDEGRFSTFRENSYETSRAWMKKISEKEVYLINKQCVAVLDMLGYPQDLIGKKI